MSLKMFFKREFRINYIMRWEENIIKGGLVCFFGIKIGNVWF